jgi:hypothetical protein
MTASQTVRVSTALYSYSPHSLMFFRKRDVGIKSFRCVFLDAECGTKNR